MSEAVLLQPAVKQLAREGDFRAIAYWLNLHLVPQQIYARVAADRPGYLLVLVEFMQMPPGDRLNRYVCYRLYQLRSPIIRGVRIIARFLGSEEIEWDQTIRLSTKRSKRRATRRSTTLQSAPAHPLLATQTARQRRLPTAKISLPRLPQQWARALRTPGGTSLNRSQVALLSGSAVAAFLLGCGVEIRNYYPPQNSAQLASAPRTDRVQTAIGKVRVIEASPTDERGAAPAQAQPSPLAEVTLSFSNTPGLLEVDPPALPTPSPDSIRNSADEAVAPAPAGGSAPQHPPDLTLTAIRPDFSALAITTSTKEHTKAPQLPDFSTTSQTGKEEARTDMAKALDALEQAGLVPVGAGHNAGEARRPEIVDVRGKRIAYLGYSDSSAASAGFWQAGTNPAMSDRIAEDIQAIRNQVDWVVVSYHWNQPLASYPSIGQMNLARHAIDAGADLVVGYHPHVLQGAEIYKGRAIAYSLGDFVFANQSQASQTDYDTAMLKVALKGDQMRLEFLPVQVVGAQPQLASGEKAQQIMGYLEKASALFKQPLRSPVVLDRQASDQTPTSSADGTLNPGFTDSDGSRPTTQPTDSFMTPPQEPATASPETQPFVGQPTPYPLVPAEESFTRPVSDLSPPTKPAEASPMPQLMPTPEEMKTIQPVESTPSDLPEPTSATPAIAPPALATDAAEEIPTEDANATEAMGDATTEASP